MQKSKIDIIPPKDFWIGNTEAPVSLVMFGDYESEACAQAHEVVKKLLVDYDRRLKFNYRHFPLTLIHQKAHKAAEAAIAVAQQGKFWEMHKLLLENQGKLIRDPNAEGDLVELGKLINVDAESFSKSLRTTDIEQKIAKQIAQAKSEGISGVPTFLINGTKIAQNPNSFEGFDALIMNELARLKLLRVH